MGKSRVAVTGVGLVTPLGLCSNDNWGRVLGGESGIGHLRRFDVSGHSCRAGAEVEDFDLAASLAIPKNVKFMSRGARYAMHAALEAVAASAIDLASFDSYRIAIHAGSGQTGVDCSDFFKALALAWDGREESDYKYDYLGGRPSRLMDKYFSLRTLSNAGVALLSAEFGAQGPNNNFVHSDTASALAVASASRDLSEDRCDVALAGGYDSLLSESTFLSYDRLGLLSSSPPESAYRPFDNRRDGIVLGEGAAFLVLERLEDAKRRAAPLWGEIAGFGSCAETGDRLQLKRDESAARAAIESARQGSDVGFIVAHGIGTPEADRHEAALLSSLFGDEIPITALKSQTGYLGAATAAVELVFTLLSLRHGLIPPIARLTRPEPDLGLDFVRRTPRPIDSDAASALCLSWSWGGQCAALLVRAMG